MKSLEITDIQNHENEKNIIEMYWENTGSIGSRGLLYINAIEDSKIENLYPKASILKKLNNDFYYFRIKPE